jgi:hypothetical protein
MSGRAKEGAMRGASGRLSLVGTGMCVVQRELLVFLGMSTRERRDGNGWHKRLEQDPPS